MDLIWFPSMDAWRASAGVFSHRRAKHTINTPKINCHARHHSLLHGGWLHLESTQPVEESESFTSGDANVWCTWRCFCVCATTVQRVWKWICCQNKRSPSAFPHTDNRLFSACHFHLSSPIKSLLAFCMLMSASWLRVSPWIPDRRYFQ